MAIYILTDDDNWEIPDIMTDDGYKNLENLAKSMTGIFDKVSVSVDDCTLCVECAVCENHRYDPDQLDDAVGAFIDILCRELVFGWNLVNDAKVVVFQQGCNYNLISSDIIYDSENRKVKVGMMRYGWKRGVVYEHEL